MPEVMTVDDRSQPPTWVRALAATLSLVIGAGVIAATLLGASATLGGFFGTESSGEHWRVVVRHLLLGAAGAALLPLVIWLWDRHKAWLVIAGLLALPNVVFTIDVYRRFGS